MRKFKGFLLLIVISLVLVGCASGNPEYRKAVKQIQETELQLDGSNELSKEILTALQSAEYTEPKNIIFMIGDGMGYNILEATRTVYKDKLLEGKLAMEYLPMQGSHNTYSVSHQITDSAAGGTALASGYKTSNQIVGMDSFARAKYKTTLEMAAEKGKSTGVVVTSYLTDATPATFTSHVFMRTLYDQIAGQQMSLFQNGKLDLAIGGGRKYFESDKNIATLQKLQKDGLTYATTWKDTKNQELPLLGVYAEETMDTASEEIPSLAEMTDFAINALSKNEEGFFLMVEGAQIDDYGEENNLEREMKETYDFDCAVAVAMRYVALHPDTVLIVTADHDTGDLEIPVEGDANEIKSQSAYFTTKHIYKPVPIYAVGYGTEALCEVVENTEVGSFVASLLGYNEIESTSNIHAVSVDDMQISFAEGNYEHAFTDTLLSEMKKDVVCAKVVQLSLSNQESEAKKLPLLKILIGQDEFTVKPQRTYVKAGEEIHISYVLPKDIWSNGRFQEIHALSLISEGENAEFKLSNIQVIDREGTK